MGRDVVRFSCHRCLHCCTDVVCFPTAWDILRIVKATGEDPYAFLEFLTKEEVTGVGKDDATWLECGEERYLMALRRDSKKGCYFLNRKKHGCSIYESRPILCRLFPFKLQETKKGKFKGFGLHSDVDCPRFKDGKVSTKPLYDLYLEDDEHQDDYIELVEEFNERNYEGKEPEDFIGMFMSHLRKYPARLSA